MNQQHHIDFVVALAMASLAAVKQEATAGYPLATWIAAFNHEAAGAAGIPLAYRWRISMALKRGAINAVSRRRGDQISPAQFLSVTAGIVVRVYRSNTKWLLRPTNALKPRRRKTEGDMLDISVSVYGKSKPSGYEPLVFEETPAFRHPEDPPTLLSDAQSRIFESYLAVRMRSLIGSHPSSA